MFESAPIEVIALIAFIALVGVGLVLAFVANVRKKRQMQELSRSSDFAAVYDEDSRKGAAAPPPPE